MNAPPEPPFATPAPASGDARPLAETLLVAAAAPGLAPSLHDVLLQASAALAGAQAAVEAGNLRYRALFDAVPDPVSVLARDGTVLDLNKAGIRAYNRPREEIIGKPI